MNNHRRYLITLNLPYMEVIAIGIMLENENTKSTKMMSFEEICEKYTIKDAEQLKNELDSFFVNLKNNDNSVYAENVMVRLESSEKNSFIPEWYSNQYKHDTELRYSFDIRNKLLDNKIAFQSFNPRFQKNITKKEQL